MKYRSTLTLSGLIIAAIALTGSTSADDRIVMRGDKAQVSIAIAGGGIIEYRFLDQKVNPLNWKISDDLESDRPKGKPYLRGHFLCLDRWGRPSDAEIKNGVPFHGEAPRIVWQVLKEPKLKRGKLSSAMGCKLPLAGLRVKRQLSLNKAGTVLTVSEEVTNTNKLGRIYNMVQHPSIAPPFLDESTIVDSNARQGFDQSGSLPTSTNPAAVWPKIVLGDERVDLRHFKNAAKDVTGSDVTSFVFADGDRLGWVTACNPRVGLMIGYIWKTSDYPWLNIWRYRFQGRVTARGLEFGTTGYHQPYPVLVKTGKILKRRLYEYIDAGQTIKKPYVMFLQKIPDGYQGVAGVRYQKGRLTFTERRDDKPRRSTLEVGKLFAE